MKSEKFDMSEHYLTEYEAALVLGVPINALKLWRVRDEMDGPRYFFDETEQVIYPTSDLRCWIRNLPTNHIGVPMLPPQRPLILH